MNEYAIIVAGGSGSRMNSNVPKQYMKIKDVPVIIHTIQKFYDYSPSIQIICCVHRDYMLEVNELLRHYFPQKKWLITEGGETRFHSVKNGLNKVNDENSIVAIHDAARPLVSIETIHKAMESAKIYGSGIPVVPINESIRIMDNNKSKALNRNDYKIVQTPQCFKTSLIQQAFLSDYQDSFTDDATVFEYTGNEVMLTEGNSENIKITLPSDFIIAEYFLS
jgi:2-C-methyl-D-erythritol 4-phosphate cytidylyltransferase